MKFLFLVLTVLGFITYQDNPRPEAATSMPGAKAVAGSPASYRGTPTALDLGQVSASEDGLPIPRR